MAIAAALTAVTAQYAITLVLNVRWYKLNCIVLGNDPNCIFPVDIAQTQTVSDLREVIKDEKKPQFDYVDADGLMLWQIDLPIDEMIERNLSSLTLDTKKPLSPVKKLQKVFSKIPVHKHLHIVIQGPPAVSSGPLHLKLNCFVLGDDLHRIFQVKIAPTESVSALQNIIKDAKGPSFDHVAADGLELWQVKIDLNDLHLLDAIRDEGVELKPLTELSEVFTDGVERKYIHIVVQHIPAVGRRFAYLKKGAGTPSAGAKPSAFSIKQGEQEYLCNRPRRAADPVPVTLLEPIFAKFVDNCQNHQPTVRDNDFVCQLSEKMSSFYPDELTWMNAFQQVLRDYGIKLNASMDGSTKWACIGFAGSVFTEKVQSDVLVPIIPLFWHSTDLRMQVMAARTFEALKIAIEELTKLYSHPIPSLEPKDPSLGCPYPRSYINSTGHTQEFSYDETQIPKDRLIFFGEIVGGAAGSKICIKFVRHYSPEAHEFCASKGHAPKLIAYNPLPGGWNMVIMDALDIDNDCFSQRPGSYRLLSEIAVLDRQPLKEAITSLIRELHDYNDGYVHGDLRDANIVVGDNNHFMLLDFDWAGPMQKTHYPMHVNRKDIRRSDGAWDGEKMVAEHDLDMLNYIFYPEQDGREPAAKRRGEGSPMTI
ncbi:hypothetical protein DFJ58DRAFT_746628 [Suillus subalutaceus]|uniref:uncharacterized protein n=1 Tax=Suillus subalutaceus TaxID=48586 RepID=UPI001B863BB9|nr:uncharacterized protein DFJ58DRAFT_746628 [Suillus subalutaceus]KAG1849261.1 hypothetical protein DFJ58DRAFT_746628 [Suillus subalutaceus]